MLQRSFSATGAGSRNASAAPKGKDSYYVLEHSNEPLWKLCEDAGKCESVGNGRKKGVFSRLAQVLSADLMDVF